MYGIWLGIFEAEHRNAYSYSEVNMYICVYIFLAGPSDYIGLSSEPVMFDTCENTSCVYIPILDDVALEVNETFTVSLDGTADLHPRVLVNPTPGEIVIIDDDSECVYVDYH